jgi:hypothetical protein
VPINVPATADKLQEHRQSRLAAPGFWSAETWVLPNLQQLHAELGHYLVCFLNCNNLDQISQQAKESAQGNLLPAAKDGAGAHILC